MTKQQRYAIIDIETTGGRATHNKITEIAIVVHDGEKVLDTYDTLVNPECPIPSNITYLTGITNEMVATAPKFYEVAKKVVEMTEGAIFVAHNVRFDYGFIQEEFRRLGYTFSRRKLCTVRLSRKAFPGLPSYSLGKLIKHFGIKVKDRHRALADTLATVDLFERILAKENSQKEVKSMVNMGMKEALLPKHWSVDKIHALPEEVGVYYFHDIEGNILYVGKSKNIQKRIAEHFADQTEKAAKLQRHVHDVSYELTGSELVALLFESHEIKRLRSPVNRAQRVRTFPYCVYTYTNEAGYICFDYAKTSAKNRKTLNIVGEFPKIASVRGRLKGIVMKYDLCDKYCGIEKGEGFCFNYHLKKCAGACGNLEDVETYNARALEAQETLGDVFEDDFFVLDTGRTKGEKAVILVENGEYKGFGYIDEEEASGVEDLYECIKSYENNPETKRIVARYLVDNTRVRLVKIT